MTPIAAEPTRLALLGVSITSEHGAADKELAKRLGDALGRELTLTYDDGFKSNAGLVERVVTTRDPYLARMTPYAFVASEMLGANLEVLATYESKTTDNYTYRSYFVVNRQSFAKHEGGQRHEYPHTLDGLYDYLKSRSEPARFIYHDQFSTSSYLLPALWFRSHRIFATDGPAPSVLRIEATKGSKSSSDSVDKVARNEADLAAVWDGTKSSYASNDGIIFIPLSETLPNDVLVASTTLDERIRTDVRKQIAKIGNIGIGDFKRWVNIDDAREALDALNELKRVARASPAPVVVRVITDTAGHDVAVASQLDAVAQEVRQAIRLAGTEFVAEEPKFHAGADVTWTINWVHDGAILLASEMLNVPNDDIRNRLRQEFHVSFTPAEGDLTTRIVSLIHSRMHRIRYVWPYQENAPTIIRDVDFTIPKGDKMYVQRLTWRDPDRNAFAVVEGFEAAPAEIRPSTFVFEKRDFIRTNTLDYQNPLSDVAYKVVLERRANESVLSKTLAATFVGLFLLAGAGAGYDLRRRLRPRKAPVPQTLPEVCAALATRLHNTCERPLTEASTLFCNRERVEEQIAELKAQGVVPAAMGGIKRLTYGFTVGGSLPFIRDFFTASGGQQVELVVDPERVGNVTRLNALLDLMIRQRLLSRFVGAPLEWEALNELARAILPGAEPGDLLIRAEDETVVKIASRHFTQVCDDGMQRLSLLRGTWSMTRRDGRCVAEQCIDLQGPIAMGDDTISSVRLEFNVADDLELPFCPVSQTIDCWILGKIARLSIADPADRPTLCLHLRVVALMLADRVNPRQVVMLRAGDVESSEARC
jgi:ABC-type phosphate/phosphonate transport system substrate-binding protein